LMRTGDTGCKKGGACLRERVRHASMLTERRFR
jgi:hypothetical protein